MAVILSPLSDIINLSEATEPVVNWQTSTEGQEAYELQYKFKKSDVWSTCGKVYSATARQTSLMAIYNLVGVDFYEVYYRIVIYYNGNNTLGYIQGKEVSDAYSLVFRHGIANTLKLYDGAGTLSYPLYDEIAIDTSKTNGEVLAQKVALDDEGTNILQLPLVSTYSIAKSKLKVCVDSETNDIKSVAESAFDFPATNIYGQTYMNQQIRTYNQVYSYDYQDVYKSYNAYGYNPLYNYQAYYDNLAIYSNYANYSYNIVYAYQLRYNSGPSYDYKTIYAYGTNIDYTYRDVYSPKYGTELKYDIVDWYYNVPITHVYVIDQTPVYGYKPVYSTTPKYSYSRGSGQYSVKQSGSGSYNTQYRYSYTYYYASGTYYTTSYSISGYYLHRYYTVEQYNYKLPASYRYSVGYTTGPWNDRSYTVGYTVYGGTYTYNGYTYYGRRYRAYGSYYYSRTYTAYYIYYKHVTEYLYGVVYYYYQPGYKTVPQQEYLPKYRISYRQETKYSKGTGSDYRPSYDYRYTYYYYTTYYYTYYTINYEGLEYRITGYTSYLDHWNNVYAEEITGYQVRYGGRTTGAYYTSYINGYYLNYRYKTTYITGYYKYISGYQIYYAGERYTTYYTTYIDKYVKYISSYGTRIDGYYRALAYKPYVSGYYKYIDHVEYYLNYRYIYNYVSNYYYNYYYYKYYRS